MHISESSVKLYIYVYIYIYIHIDVCIYAHIYIYVEIWRGSFCRKTHSHSWWYNSRGVPSFPSLQTTLWKSKPDDLYKLCLCVYIYIYITYMYVYIYIHIYIYMSQEKYLFLEHETIKI